MNEENTKKYEVGLLLRSEEAAGPVLDILKTSGVAIESHSNPAKIKLAYPIKKEVSAYFTYVIFSSAPENIAKLQEELKHNLEILRFLVVTPPIIKEERRERDRDRERSFSPKPKPAPPVEKPLKEPEMSQQPEMVTNELLEKKLEEILG